MAWHWVAIPWIISGESVTVIVVTQFHSYLAVEKLPEKKNKAKPIRRSILEIGIRTNTQNNCGVIQLGRAKAAQLETVSWPGNRIENDTVTKSLHGTYPTVKSNRLYQGDLVLRPLRFVNWIWIWPDMSSQAILSQAESKIVVWLFSLRYSAGAYRRKRQHFKTSLPVIAVWLSVYSKIYESCKSEVKPQIKVVIVQQSAALRSRFTIFTSRASLFCARPLLNRCAFAVYTTNEIVSFWKRYTFDSVLKTTRFW